MNFNWSTVLTSSQNTTDIPPLLNTSQERENTDNDYLSAEQKYIILIGTPILFVLGIMGNFLSAAIMLRRHFRSMSTGAFLFALSLADTVFLSVNSMTKNFIVLLTGVDLTKLSWWTCKFYVFILMTSKCLSAWFIVGVTSERLLIVCIPHKAKILTTRKRAWIAILLISVITMGIFSMVLITYGLVPRPWGQDCTMIPMYDDQGLRIILNTLDLVLYSILPSAILFISNVILIIKVMRSRRMRQQPNQEGSRSDDITRLTIMLISVSVMFLICTSPVSILFLVKSVDDSIKNAPGYYEIYRALYLLQLSNSAINFILYCFSGPVFRAELKSLFGCCERDKKSRYRQSYSAESMDRSPSVISSPLSSCKTISAAM